MPTLVRLAKSTVALYPSDHLPPHFHVRMNDGREALIVINNLTVLSGSIKTYELAKALVWAQSNRTALVQKWQELNR